MSGGFVGETVQPFRLTSSSLLRTALTWQRWSGAAVHRPAWKPWEWSLRTPTPQQRSLGSSGWDQQSHMHTRTELEGLAMEARIDFRAVHP